uniref:Sister chromatid cohesion 1 protein 3 n=1 Tax=Caenorhabditis tropicalis TaxID=1561998 RepID=A0A1I7U8P8_9PELO
MESFSARYVVPEVIPESVEMDIRSAGNPYAHHPNYTTPSEYFNHIDAPPPAEDVLTAMDIANLKDPFGDKEPVIEIRAPNDVTINKHAFTAESLADLRDLHVSFPTKPSAPIEFRPLPSATETLNKKLLSPESLYELGQLADEFEEKESMADMVIREFSPQTLADLREIRNFSQYTDFPTRDVDTAMAISPNSIERFQFEWTENVVYGGI